MGEEMTAQAREPTQYSTTLANASDSPGTLMAQQVRGLTASVDKTDAAMLQPRNACDFAHSPMLELL